MLRSLWKLESVPLGMETDHVLTARFVLGKQRYASDEQQLVLFNELEQRLASAPGVQVSAITDSIPLKRMIQPAEIARLALYLASDISQGITGQAVVLDAGFLVR